MQTDANHQCSERRHSYFSSGRLRGSLREKKRVDGRITCCKHSRCYAVQEQRVGGRHLVCVRLTLRFRIQPQSNRPQDSTKWYAFVLSCSLRPSSIDHDRGCGGMMTSKRASSGRKQMVQEIGRIWYGRRRGIEPREQPVTLLANPSSSTFTVAVPHCTRVAEPAEAMRPTPRRAVRAPSRTGNDALHRSQPVRAFFKAASQGHGLLGRLLLVSMPLELRAARHEE